MGLKPPPRNFSTTRKKGGREGKEGKREKRGRKEKKRKEGEGRKERRKEGRRKRLSTSVSSICVVVCRPRPSFITLAARAAEVGCQGGYSPPLKSNGRTSQIC